ncbi:MAG: SemiSWEET family transporter [Spiroplasma sp.]|nr:SemiSWEET family transporter [Spiroplasma sp.]
MPIAVQVLGYLASICIPLAFLPQTLKTIIKRETKGISIIAYIIYFLGCVIFLIYGVLLTDIPMIICQTIAAIFAAIILIITGYNLIKSKGQDPKQGKKEQIKSGMKVIKDEIKEEVKDLKKSKETKEGDKK